MRSLFLAFLIAVTLQGFCWAGDIRNGNWWRGLEQGQKLNYTTGFFDGMDLGANFSVWGLDDPAQKNGCRDAAIFAYSGYVSKYFKNVTNGQLTDGLNTFHEDYRNRKISVYNAMWLVLRAISGEPEEELNKIIQIDRVRILSWSKFPLIS